MKYYLYWSSDFFFKIGEGINCKTRKNYFKISFPLTSVHLHPGLQRRAELVDGGLEVTRLVVVLLVLDVREKRRRERRVRERRMKTMPNQFRHLDENAVAFLQLPRFRSRIFLRGSTEHGLDASSRRSREEEKSKKRGPRRHRHPP